MWEIFLILIKLIFPNSWLDITEKINKKMFWNIEDFSLLLEMTVIVYLDLISSFKIRLINLIILNNQYHIKISFYFIIMKKTIIILFLTSILIISCSKTQETTTKVKEVKQPQVNIRTWNLENNSWKIEEVLTWNEEQNSQILTISLNKNNDNSWEILSKNWKSTKYFEIKELGLKFPSENNSLSDLNYKIEQWWDWDIYAEITSKILSSEQTKKGYCVTHINLLKIPWKSADYQDYPPAIKQFNNFFVTAWWPPEGCSEDKNTETMEWKFIEDTIKKLEGIIEM